MGFLLPSALALSALAIPIIIFYMLKLRRRPARVSSLMLWQQVLQDRQANTPWQRLKRNILLMLQLVILSLLVMALARPYFTVQARVQGNVVILLDASASMQARDVLPSRFAAAQEAVSDLIGSLASDDAVTLITIERTPRVLASASTDRTALGQLLRRAKPSYGPADWEAALTLAAASAATFPEATVVIVSDGAVGPSLTSKNLVVEQADPSSVRGRPPRITLPSFPAPVTFIPIGHSADNQGLVALSLRDGTNGPELFLRVLNAASRPVRRLVEIEVNGELYDARRLDIPARAGASLTLSGLPLNTRQVQAQLTGDDALPADDTAWALRSAAPGRILLVGEGNLFLERALALLPDIKVQRTAPDQPLPQARFDLVIFDRAVPPGNARESLSESNLLFIAPPASTHLFEVSGVITQTRLTRLQSNDPLLSYVKLNNLQVARAQAIKPPSWARSLVEARGGPLVMAGQTGTQRVAVIAFDLHQSDLPLQIDFPILMVNLTRWLVPTNNSMQGQIRQAGQSVDLPTATAANVLVVKSPDGTQAAVPPSEGTFSQTDALGVYEVLAQEPGRDKPTLLIKFVINLLSELESDIQPNELESLGTDEAAINQSLTGQREWWWSLALLALGVLLVEWWVYWRGEGR